MKKIILHIFLFLTLTELLLAQNVGINNPTPAASAILDLTSSDKGLLLPRLTTLQRTSIPVPAFGLMVCDTTLNAIYYWDKTTWRALLTSTSTGWLTTGNSGTNPAVNFIGTTDNQSLKFKVNNLPAGTIQTDGQTFVGINSGINNAGAYNNGFGNSALRFNTSGQYNTATGYRTLYTNTTGSNNSSFGANSLFSNSTGYENSAFGSGALRSNSTGNDNSAFGFNTLYSNTTGLMNSAFGNFALYNNTSGGWNCAFGLGSLTANTSGNSNSAFGNNALNSNTTGSSNTAFGLSALNSNTSGTQNTASGQGALASNTTGQYNTASGYGAIANNTVGSYNTAVGVSSNNSNTLGDFNTSMGFTALLGNSTASENTALGYSALNTQSFNNSNTKWNSENVAVGVNALYWNQPVSTTTGNRNTAVGHSSLKANTTGSTCAAIGYNAGISNTTGINNTYLGASTGGIGSFNNITSVGYGASVTLGSNSISIGNTSVSWIGGQVNWATYSDGRIKDHIQQDVAGLVFINKLIPVTYNYNIHRSNEILGNKDSSTWKEKYDVEKIRFSGFIAQQVEEAACQAKYNFSGVVKPDNENDLYSIRYAEFVVPLVKSTQELSAQNEVLKSEVSDMKKLIDSLLVRIQKLEGK